MWGCKLYHAGVPKAIGKCFKKIGTSGDAYICRTNKLGMKILKQQVQRLKLISAGSQVKWGYKTSTIT